MIVQACHLLLEMISSRSIIKPTGSPPPSKRFGTNIRKKTNQPEVYFLLVNLSPDQVASIAQIL